MDIDEVVEEGGVPDVTLAGVHTGSFAAFHDGQIVPDSLCTMDTFAALKRDYKIPDSVTLSLPHRGYHVYTPPKNQLLIHKAAFECRVRLPLHPTLRWALVALELAPYRSRRDSGST